LEIGGHWNAEVEYLGHWGAYVDAALASAVFAVLLLIEWRTIAEYATIHDRRFLPVSEVAGKSADGAGGCNLLLGGHFADGLDHQLGFIEMDPMAAFGGDDVFSVERVVRNGVAFG